MELLELSDRDTAIAVAIGRGVSLRAVCSIYDLDATTVRRIVEASGAVMPVQDQGPQVIIAERDSEILRRAFNGEDFTVISKAHGIGRERVRQIVKEHTGLSARDLRSARVNARREYREHKARDLAAGNREMTAEEIGGRSGLSVGDVEKLLGRAEAARRRPSRTITTATERDQFLADIRRVAALPGGTPLSGPFYDRHRGEARSSQRIIQVFGTWRAACDAAEVVPVDPIRSEYKQRWDREDCLRWVVRYADSVEKATYLGLEAWLKSQEGAPSAGTVRLRCGSWNRTLRDAYALRSGEALKPLDFNASYPHEPPAAARGGELDTQPPEPAEPWTPADETGQGHSNDPEVRLKVENAAQDRLMAHYRRLGWKVSDTRANSPYDALATRGNETVYLEAKGTRSAGTSVLVTRGEVEHARANRGRCVMGVWSGIEFDDAGEVRPESGEFRVVPFDPDSGALTIIGYEWTPE